MVSEAPRWARHLVYGGDIGDSADWSGHCMEVGRVEIYTFLGIDIYMYTPGADHTSQKTKRYIAFIFHRV